jgi:hypothetical protein
LIIGNYASLQQAEVAKTNISAVSGEQHLWVRKASDLKTK